MHHALPGSVLVHAAVLGIALLGFSWPDAEDAPAAEAVTVSIVSMTSVSANATEIVQSDSTVNLVSSGLATNAPAMVEPVEPEPVQPIAERVTALAPEPQTQVSTESVMPAPSEEVAPIEPGPQQPIGTQAQPAEVAPQTPEPIQSATDAEPLEATTEIAILNWSAVSSVTAQPLAATPPPTLEPLSSEYLKTAPVPQTLSLERASRPTYPKPAPEQPLQQPRPTAPQPNQPGNGGANKADSVASAGSTAPQAGSGSGGEAEVARYPSQVLGKLRRALRSSNGPRGEVVVRFTVQANGQVSGIGIGRSSGNAAVDQAGLATVNRAAPFSPIPPQANRPTWTFDVPLAFGG